MLHNDKMIQSVLSLLIGVAALNWALVTFWHYDVLVDGVGLAVNSQMYELVIGAIAVAVVLRWYSVYEWASGGMSD